MGSLRARLIASYVAIVLLSLALSGGAALLILRDYQHQLRLNQLADLALPLAFQVGVLERSGATGEQINAFLVEQAGEMGLRILLIARDDRIVGDTRGELQGQELSLADVEHFRGRLSIYAGSFLASDGRAMVAVAAPVRSFGQSASVAGRPPLRAIVLAVPQRRLADAWLELAPSLSLAALGALVLSIAVALLLASSLARPIAQLTGASEEMARGNFDVSVPVRGRGELARLAATFNRMAQDVGTSQRTLRSLLANVSHELRTPLTSIQGFSQAIVDGSLHDPQGFVEAGRIINDEAVRMRRLVDDLLDLSRIESGQVTMDRRPLDLRRLLETCVRRVERRATENGVAVELTLPAVPPVDADERRMEQVFGNLLDNALRYTPTGGRITIKPAEHGNGGRPHLAIGVHNTGSYISSEDLPRVFERFYQVDPARRRDAEGSGLGLSIVREIVLAHGGTIEARSDPAAGTEFVVVLPTTVCSRSS